MLLAMIDAPQIERLLAILGGIVVFFVSAIALKNDWKTPGIENHIFKLMLGLLALGAIVAILAGMNILGDFPVKAA